MPEVDALQRFLSAQESSYEQALAELRAGHKQGHWMWFIFPQLQGLGRSRMAQTYAIHGLSEAEAYYLHPVLGVRYRECLQVLLELRGRSAEQVFAYPDVLKLRSSLSLFARVDGQGLCERVLAKYYGGEADPLTLSALAASRH